MIIYDLLTKISIITSSVVHEMCHLMGQILASFKNYLRHCLGYQGGDYEPLTHGIEMPENSTHLGFPSTEENKKLIDQCEKIERFDKKVPILSHKKEEKSAMKETNPVKSQQLEPSKFDVFSSEPVVADSTPRSADQEVERSLSISSTSANTQSVSVSMLNLLKTESSSEKNSQANIEVVSVQKNNSLLPAIDKNEKEQPKEEVIDAPIEPVTTIIIAPPEEKQIEEPKVERESEKPITTRPQRSKSIKISGLAEKLGNVNLQLALQPQGIGRKFSHGSKAPKIEEEKPIKETVESKQMTSLLLGVETKRRARKDSKKRPPSDAFLMNYLDLSSNQNLKPQKSFENQTLPKESDTNLSEKESISDSSSQNERGTRTLSFKLSLNTIDEESEKKRELLQPHIDKHEESESDFSGSDSGQFPLTTESEQPEEFQRLTIEPLSDDKNASLDEFFSAEESVEKSQIDDPEADSNAPERFLKKQFEGFE